MSETRVCKKCHTEKDIEEFPKKGALRRHECKLCRADYEKKWRLENIERELERSRNYYLKNKEKCREDGKRRYLRNKERITEVNKKWFLANQERVKEYKRKWFLENKERLMDKRRLWNLENKNLVLAHKRRWMDANRDIVNERRRERRKLLPLWYVNNVLGGTAKNKYPDELLFLKQMYMKVNRLLKEKQ